VNARARVLLLGPYVLLLTVFFVAPLLLLFGISLSKQSYGQLEWAFTLQHYVHFFTDAYYLGVLADTLWLGVLTTAVALLLVGIVIRCYGWMILLADRGLINETLVQRGWIAKPLPLMYNKFGVVVALVHVFLPFMVLSLTGVLKRIEPQLIEASQTLGASPGRAFLEVTLPLSLPGVLAGSLLVFSLAISSFVVPILVGGFKVHVLPMVVYEQVLSVFDWPFGAANAFVLLVISVVLIGVYIKVTERALRGIV
jgi:putative spermidine/putrescine transport system permease protein